MDPTPDDPFSFPDVETLYRLLKERGPLGPLTKPVPPFNPPTGPVLPIEGFPDDHPAYDRAHALFLALPAGTCDTYTLRERYLFEVMICYTETMNGGFDLYFWGGGAHALHCLEAYQAIGAKSEYQDLQQACALFPEGHPAADQETRGAQMEEICARYQVEDFDDVPLPPVEDDGEGFQLFAKVMAYWDAHEPLESPSM